MDSVNPGFRSIGGATLELIEFKKEKHPLITSENL